MPHVPAQIRHAGSGTLVAFVAIATAIALVALTHFVGWNETWRSFGVVPLEPHFYDMHAVTDNAACARNGFDAYRATRCTSILPFNYPPIWLWLGKVDVDEAAAPWLAILMAVFAFVVLTLLFRGRSAAAGIVFSLALMSPPVLMAVERGNIDLCIIGLVGTAALVFNDNKRSCSIVSCALIFGAVVLKLYPLFCIAVGVRLNRRTIIFSGIITVLSAAYLVLIWEYLPLIRHNTSTTYILSYGYKVLFLGFDHLEAASGGASTRIADTLAPVALLLAALLAAAVTAVIAFFRQSTLFTIRNTTAGNAFLFGAGIYVGTFLLGSNFMYRLSFLMLCLPQLQDWASGSARGNRQASLANALVAVILCALWSNGSNGHASFMFVSQILDLGLFFGLAAALFVNLNIGIRRHKRGTELGGLAKQ